jgi:hypothetical protein
MMLFPTLYYSIFDAHPQIVCNVRDPAGQGVITFIGAGNPVSDPRDLQILPLSHPPAFCRQRMQRIRF